jgi:hypothetical protein
MNDTNFIDLNYSPDSDLLVELYELAKADQFYISPSNVYRTDIMGPLRDKLQNIVNAEIADCGILRSEPNSVYPYHVDEFRVCAINMLMVEPSDYHVTRTMVGIKPERVNYRQNYFMMLNVMKLHMTMNKHPTEYRYVLSLGFKENSYENMLQMNRKGLLIK